MKFKKSVLSLFQVWRQTTIFIHQFVIHLFQLEFSKFDVMSFLLEQSHVQFFYLCFLFFSWLFLCRIWLLILIINWFEAISDILEVALFRKQVFENWCQNLFSLKRRVQHIFIFNISLYCFFIQVCVFKYCIFDFLF